MDQLIVARAVCFMRICIVAILSETGLMVYCLWRYNGERKILYPGMSMFANIPRAALALNLLRSIRVQSDRDAPGGRLVRRGDLRLWSAYSALMSVWYSVLLALTQDPDFGGLVLVLVGMNFQIWLTSLCVLAGPSPSTPIVVETFQLRIEAGVGPPLQFGTNCSICLGDLDEGQQIGRLPCGHTFHEPCIREWLARKDCCPMRCAEPEAAPCGAADAAIDGAAASEAAEDWAEGQVPSSLSGGAIDVVLHPQGVAEVSEPASPPESEPSVVCV